MKFKLVPEPPDAPGFVADAQAAVPLVPGSEDDCCARLQRRLGFRSRDVARTWLTFLRALDLAAETQDGFKRRRTEPTPEYLREHLLTGVYGASDVAAALLAANEEEKPLTGTTVFEQFVHRVPEWERYRTDEWETVWRERVDHLLGWFVLLDLAAERDGGYAPTESLRELMTEHDDETGR